MKSNLLDLFWYWIKTNTNDFSRRVFESKRLFFVEVLELRIYSPNNISMLSKKILIVYKKQILDEKFCEKNLKKETG